jgi:hypothetical protein
MNFRGNPVKSSVRVWFKSDKKNFKDKSFIYSDTSTHIYGTKNFIIGNQH